jgi:trk system potassium uptake protein TrkA
MRVVFVGAGRVAAHAAEILSKSGHEVILVEDDKARIDELRETLDCGFVQGDGGTPAILRETDPEKTDVLFCLTNNDQTNIIASLVGRSLGFKRVVTRIENPQYERICTELGLKDTIVPARTIGRYLADMSVGHDTLELSAMIKGEARVFSWVVGEQDETAVSELDLPADTRVVCCYRDETFTLPEPGDALHAGDEVVVITHRRNLPELEKRWGGSSRRAEAPAEG